MVQAKNESFAMKSWIQNRKGVDGKGGAGGCPQRPSATGGKQRDLSRSSPSVSGFVYALHRRSSTHSLPNRQMEVQTAGRFSCHSVDNGLDIGNPLVP